MHDAQKEREIWRERRETGGREERWGRRRERESERAREQESERAIIRNDLKAAAIPSMLRLTIFQVLTTFVTRFRCYNDFYFVTFEGAK